MMGPDDTSARTNSTGGSSTGSGSRSSSRRSRAAGRISARLREGRRFLVNRLSAGLIRARRSVLPALQMTVAGVGAYAFAERVLGHEAPIFAAVAALVATGFSKEPQLRRTAEVALGCTLGILIGDTVLYFFGTGLGTALAVVFFSIMLARILDPGATFTMQMGLQAMLVVLLPAPEGAPLVRSMDAVIGGVVAILITAVTPKDLRREPVRELKTISEELIKALRETGAAVRATDSRQAWHALIRCRGLQSQIEGVATSVRSARELTRYSLTSRHQRHDVRSMDRVASQLDLAVRSMRVVSRRTVSMLDHTGLSDDGAERLGTVFEELAEGTLLLSRTVSETSSGDSPRMSVARDAYAQVARRLHPARLSVDTLEGETVVLLLRTMVVDLLEATGLDHDDAVAHLPALD